MIYKFYVLSVFLFVSHWTGISHARDLDTPSQEKQIIIDNSVPSGSTVPPDTNNYLYSICVTTNVPQGKNYGYRVFRNDIPILF